MDGKEVPGLAGASRPLVRLSLVMSHVCTCSYSSYFGFQKECCLCREGSRRNLFVMECRPGTASFWRTWELVMQGTNHKTDGVAGPTPGDECRLLAIGAGNGRGRVRVCTVDENPGNMAIVQASDRRETGRGVSLSGRAVNKTRYKVELVLWKFHVFFHAKLGRNERSA